jgi:predicted MFS family arabinose efflux permease
MTSYFIRSHGMLIGDATVRVALISGVAGAIGTYLGGYLGNRVAERDLSKASLVGAWGFIVAAPLFAFGFMAPDPGLATALLMLGTMAQLTYFGPAFAILHATVEPRMRATAVALVLLVTNLLGYGLGPPIVGASSDALAEFLRSNSAAEGICASASWLRAACETPAAGGLQWTLSLLAIGNIWAFYHFFMVSRHHGDLVKESGTTHTH